MVDRPCCRCNCRAAERPPRPLRRRRARPPRPRRRRADERTSSIPSLSNPSDPARLGGGRPHRTRGGPGLVPRSAVPLALGEDRRPVRDRRHHRARGGAAVAGPAAQVPVDHPAPGRWPPRRPDAGHRRAGPDPRAGAVPGGVAGRRHPAVRRGVGAALQRAGRRRPPPGHGLRDGGRRHHLGADDRRRPPAVPRVGAGLRAARRHPRGVRADGRDPAAAAGPAGRPGGDDPHVGGDHHRPARGDAEPVLLQRLLRRRAVAERSLGRVRRGGPRRCGGRCGRGRAAGPRPPAPAGPRRARGGRRHHVRRRRLRHGRDGPPRGRPVRHHGDGRDPRQPTVGQRPEPAHLRRPHRVAADRFALHRAGVPGRARIDPRPPPRHPGPGRVPGARGPPPRRVPLHVPLQAARAAGAGVPRLHGPARHRRGGVGRLLLVAPGPDRPAQPDPRAGHLRGDHRARHHLRAGGEAVRPPPQGRPAPPPRPAADQRAALGHRPGPRADGGRRAHHRRRPRALGPGRPVRPRLPRVRRADPRPTADRGRRGRPGGRDRLARRRDQPVRGRGPRRGAGEGSRPAALDRGVPPPRPHRPRRRPEGPAPLLARGQPGAAAGHPLVPRGAHRARAHRTHGHRRPRRRRPPRRLERPTGQHLRGGLPADRGRAAAGGARDRGGAHGDARRLRSGRTRRGSTRRLLSLSGRPSPGWSRARRTSHPARGGPRGCPPRRRGRRPSRR